MENDKNSAISESELARRTAVSTAVLRKWRREGKGPRFLRLGRCVRYLIADVDSWLCSRAFDCGQVRARNGKQ